MSDDNQIMTLSTVNAALKDRYPLPGDRIKQYVVDHNREWKWERATAPRFNVDPHDRPGCYLHGDSECEHCKVLTHRCPCEGRTSLLALRDAECDVCNEMYERSLPLPSVVAWLTEKATRPPICTDRSKLSDEIAPEYPACDEHPLFGMIPRKP